MEITFTPNALAFLGEKQAGAVTMTSLIFTSCCSGPLPPEVKPGAPADQEGFVVYPAGDLTLYFDSLLDPRPALVIDLKDYGTYRELFVQGWE